MNKQRKKSTITIIILLSLIPLAFFKYAGFLFCDVLGILDENCFKGWITPLGVSFYTFQALSYSIDLYRGKISAENNLLDFSLFVAFFPTILSGPIERSRNLLPQIKKERNIDWGNIYSSVCIFSWGLFKKIVIADRLSAYIDSIYISPSLQSSATLIFAAVLYSLQIYCDFSGYSDMAIGVARGLGFDVTQNFHFPYFASTIKEFWRRWHISLTSWFTEYVYFSLGGSRVKTKVCWVFNISMIFLLSGIWHGAAWGFIIWGVLHAVLYLIEHFLGLQSKDFKPSVLFKVLYTPIVFIMVTIAWIFFRAESFDLAWQILTGIFTNGGTRIATGASMMTFSCNMMLVLMFIVAESIIYFKKVWIMKPFIREGLLVAIWIMLCLFASGSDSFVYFQF